MRAGIEERAAASAGIPREYFEGRGPYPERLPWLILAGKFLDEIEQAVDRWAQWATGVVESWPDDLRAAQPDVAALEQMAERAEAHVARLAERRRRPKT